jgi:hypothetical protein
MLAYWARRARKSTQDGFEILDTSEKPRKRAAMILLTVGFYGSFAVARMP